MKRWIFTPVSKTSQNRVPNTKGVESIKFLSNGNNFSNRFFLREGLPPEASKTVSKILLKSPEKIGWKDPSRLWFSRREISVSKVTN